MTLNEIELLYVIPVVLLTQFTVTRQYVHSQLLLLLHHCVKCTLSRLLLSLAGILTLASQSLHCIGHSGEDSDA